MKQLIKTISLPSIILQYRKTLIIFSSISAIFIFQWIFASVFWNKYLPLTEGWWHVYAIWIDRGQVPYRDFELLVPPLYPLIIKWFSDIGINSFSEFRFLGVFIHTVIAISLYFIARKFSSNSYALIISLLISIYLQSGVAFINYDYIYFNILFFLLATFLFLGYADKRNRTAIVFIGILLSFSFLIKQSQGVIYIMFFTFSVLILAYKDKSLKHFSYYLLGLFLGFSPFLIWLFINKALGAFLSQTIYSATETKGGLDVSLFNWIKFILFDTNSLTRNLIIFLNVLIILGLTRYVFEKLNFSNLIFFLISPFIFFLFFRWGYPTNINSLFISYAFALSIIMLFLSVALIPFLLKSNFKLAFLSFSALAVAWACGTSAGLTEIGIYFPLFVFLIFLFLLIDSNKILVISLLMILLTYTGSQMESKRNSPFQWWGYSAGTGVLPGVYLENETVGKIYIPTNEKLLIDNVTEAISLGISCNAKSFVFPHMPIFQLMTNSLPNLYQATNWLDFSSESGLQENFNLMVEINPGSIVLIDLPEFVWEGHERLFNNSKPLAHREIEIKLQQFINDNGYKLQYENNITPEYTIKVFVKSC